MELSDYSRAHGRKGDCHAVEAAERFEYLLQGASVKRRKVRIASFRKSSKTAGARGRLRRGVAYKQGGRWHDAATTLMREGEGLWDPNGKEWAWNNRSLEDRRGGRGGGASASGTRSRAGQGRSRTSRWP